MAVQDILDAIIGQTDQQLAQAQAAHRQRMADLRDSTDRTIAKKRQDIGEQKELKKQQLRRKTEALAAGRRRHTILQTKQQLIDDVYTQVTAALAALPDAEIAPLFEACLRSIDGTGTIHPSSKHEQLLQRLAGHRFTMGSVIPAAGGFRFVSDAQEKDCTLEMLIHNVLRPATELATAHALFPDRA